MSIRSRRESLTHVRNGLGSMALTSLLVAAGATDSIGLRAVENPIDRHDLHAAIMHLMGLDHLRVTYPHNGREERAPVVAGRVVKEAVA